MRVSVNFDAAGMVQYRNESDKLMTQYRILIADDEEEIRYMLELHLRRAGHTVVCVEDGQAALDELLKHPYDFVLCDLVMPNLMVSRS